VIQQKLGLRTDVACFDLNAACSGFVYALDTGCAMLSSGRYRRALIIGVEKLSSIVDWQDRTTCVLFGDGAGAAVIGLSDRPGIGLLGTRLGAYGGSVDLLWVTHGGSSQPTTAESIEARHHCIKMKGKEVFKLAVRAMDEAARDILEQHKVTADQIALVIPHQANLRIIESISQYLKLPMDRFFVNVDRYGNTSAASIWGGLDLRKRTDSLVNLFACPTCPLARTVLSACSFASSVLPPTPRGLTSSGIPIRAGESRAVFSRA
jgi:3-oxoacyl-[acyl-carrier-protein] synthase-3